MVPEENNFNGAVFILNETSISIIAAPTLSDGSKFDLNLYLHEIDWDGVWVYLRPGAANTIFTVKAKKKSRKLRNITETLIAMGATQVDKF